MSEPITASIHPVTILFRMRAAKRIDEQIMAAPSASAHISDNDAIIICDPDRRPAGTRSDDL